MRYVRGSELIFEVLRSRVREVTIGMNINILEKIWSWQCMGKSV